VPVVTSYRDEVAGNPWITIRVTCHMMPGRIGPRTGQIGKVTQNML